MAPEVSVIVPIYKAERYLRQCVDSIRAQTMAGIEIILVDDGSPDGCPEMCDQFAAEDQRIRVLHQKNGGVSAARNRGLEMAKADWIMFADPDDWLEPDAVQALLELAAGTGCQIACGSHYDHSPAGQIPAGANDSSVRAYSPERDFDFLMGCVLEENVEGRIGLAAPWGKLYRKRFLADHRIRFPEGLIRCQDKIFNLYAVYSAEKICFADRAVYHYRQHGGSNALRLHLRQRERFYGELDAFARRFRIQEAFRPHLDCAMAAQAVALAKLLGRSAGSLSAFREGAASIREFCSGDVYQRALADPRLPSMLGRKGAAAAWLLKHRLYRTALLLCALHGRWHSNRPEE